MKTSKRKLMSKTFKQAALATVLLGASITHASDFEPSIYLGADAGKSSYTQPGVSTGDPTFGLKLGYQMTPHFAAEVLLRSLSFRIDGPFTDSAYYPENNRSIAMLGILPMGEHFSTYAKLGVGATTMHSASVARKDFEKTEAMLSIGGNYALSKNWKLYVEATHFNQLGVNLFTVGAQFHF